MSDYNQYTQMDFNKLAAYLDGNLTADEMERMESYISSDTQLSAMMDEIDELDEQIIENCYSDDFISDAQFWDDTLPEVGSLSINDDFFNAVDSSNEFFSTLFADNLSFTDENSIDFHDGYPTDLMDDDTFNDL